MRVEIKNQLIQDLQGVDGISTVDWWPLTGASQTPQQFPAAFLLPIDDLFREGTPKVRESQRSRESVFQMKLQVVHSTADDLEALLQKIEKVLGEKEWTYDGWQFGAETDGQTFVSAQASVKRVYPKNYFEEPGGTAIIGEKK